LPATPAPSSRPKENATPNISLEDLTRQNRAKAVLKSSAAHVESLAPMFVKSTRKALLPLFASITKKGTSANDAPLLLDALETKVLESDRSERERRRAAHVASDKKAKAAKTSNKPSYKRKRQKTVDQKRLVWQHGVDHLAHFVKNKTVDGLVHTTDGIDYTDQGSEWILDKVFLSFCLSFPLMFATYVYIYIYICLHIYTYIYIYNSFLLFDSSLPFFPPPPLYVIYKHTGSGGLSVFHRATGRQG
jgi:hypothetical protein